MPVWLSDEHLIQLGPTDLCQDIFQLYISAEMLLNTQKLYQDLPKNENNVFSFIYNIFDTFVRLKPFKLEPDNMPLNERIMIRVRTSISVLKRYLHTKTHFFVKLKHNNDTIGISEINLKPLVREDSLQQFLHTNENAIASMQCNCILNETQCKEGRGDCQKGKIVL